MQTLETIIAFIIIFGALVFFHELGHLVFAKRAGILCREFAIGFGPKVFTYKKKETVYTIRFFHWADMCVWLVKTQKISN